MKKAIVVFALLFILGSILTSCKSRKAPCPAYRGMHKYGNVDNTNKQNTIEHLILTDENMNVKQTTD